MTEELPHLFATRKFDQQAYEKACKAYNSCGFETGSEKAYAEVMHLYQLAKKQGIPVVLPWNRKASE